MSSEQIREGLARVMTPFWITLDSGEQNACQSVLSFDGFALSVIVGTEPRMLFAPHIRAITQSVTVPEA